MKDSIQNWRWLFCTVVFLLAIFSSAEARAQEKIKVAYSSTDSINQVWTIAYDAGFFKKHGLDVDLVYIGSTTVGIAAIVSHDIQVGNAAGSGVANAAVRGADTVSAGCVINVLAYELVVHDSVKSAEDLKGKSIGISRLGSASDVAARALIRGLGMEPDKQIPIMQVGGPAERAAAFRAGRISGFPSPPGTIHLTKGMPFRILISTADFQKRFDFPYICSTTTKSYLATHRDTMRRLTMALIESTHFLKTRKE